MPTTKARRKKNPAHTAYERALMLLYKGNYAKAQAALEAFAQKYPDEKQIMAQVSMFPQALRAEEPATEEGGPGRRRTL